MKSQMINFLIYQNLLDEVDIIARKKQKSRSEVIREAIVQMLDEQNQDQKDFANIKKAAERVNLSEKEAFELIEKTRNDIQINK